MPIFATLVASAVNGLITFFSLFMKYEQAIAWGRRTFIIALGAALLAAVTGCVTYLLTLMGSALAEAPPRFAMGLGMIIPANAAGVLSCCGSVWLACAIYRLKLEGLRW